MVYRAEKPIVAAVNGAAVAGGAALVTACDLAVAAEPAEIGYPAVGRGMVAAVVMEFLRRRVGEQRTRYLLLTGGLLTARQACRIGLVGECVAAGDCLSRSLELARQCSSYPAGAYADTKELLARTRLADPVTGGPQARRIHTEMRFSE